MPVQQLGLGGGAALASLAAGLVTAVLIATLAAMTTALAPAGQVGPVAPGLRAAAVISSGPALPALARILIGSGLELVGTDLARAQPRCTLGTRRCATGSGSCR